MGLFDVLKKREPEEDSKIPEKLNEVEYLPELPPMELKEMKRILATLCDFNSADECIYCPLEGKCPFWGETKIWNINEAQARYLCKILLKEVEQAKEYLKQRVQLIGDELVVELPKDVEEGKIKITFAKCDKTRSELKERKKGELE